VKSSFYRQRKEISQLNEGEEKSQLLASASISLASTEALSQPKSIESH
jgi:hypothetical protein